MLEPKAEILHVKQLRNLLDDLLNERITAPANPEAEREANFIHKQIWILRELDYPPHPMGYCKILRENVQITRAIFCNHEAATAQERVIAHLEKHFIHLLN